MRAALGWSVHTGWAVVVGVGHDGSSPVLLHRERVAFVPDEVPRQAYHAAELLPLAEAETLVRRVEAAARAGAADGVSSMVRALSAEGHDVVVSAVLGELHDLPPLERILASHALLHTAEGVLYRELVVDAGETCGLATRLVPARQVATLAADAQGWTVERGDAWLVETGRAAGPPWQKDHKQAALAALTAVVVG